MDKIEFGSFAFQFDTESTGGQGRQGSYKQPSLVIMLRGRMP